MPCSLVTSTNLDYLATLPHIKGVVALNSSSMTSPDVTVPHGATTPDAAYTIGPDYNGGAGWNTQGSGIIYHSYNFPVVLATGVCESCFYSRKALPDGLVVIYI